MIVETNSDDYGALREGSAPRQFTLADTAVASPEIIEMLDRIATTVREKFSPASWLMIENGEVVGLCSITRPPADSVIDIGYGVAPSRQNRGIARKAIGEIVRWACSTHRVVAITADTAPDNIASQRVLHNNGFVRVGERIDAEDGQLLCWLRITA